MDIINADETIQNREMVERAIMKINTAIPGIIQSFDSSKQTVAVVPAIKMRTMIDGNESFVQLPKILEVPIVFPIAATKGFALTIPVSAGDSCLLIFSQRAIDNWHDRDGVQIPESSGSGSRHHDLTDAFAILSPVPLPNVLSNWENNGIELRNTSKTSRITVKDEEIEIQCSNTSIFVNADGTIVINASASITATSPLTTFNGNVQINGELLSTGKIESQISIEDSVGTMQEIRDIYNEHTHPDPQGGNTNPPNEEM